MGHDPDNSRGGAVDLTARCGAYLVVLAITCILVFHYRFIPIDDCLHHAAKAISGRQWNDILVLRDDIRLDPNPGWHAILSLAHRVTGCGPETLVIFSYVSLLIMAMLAVLPLFRRPEAWVIALTVAGVALPETFYSRLTRGRPYLLTEAFLLILLYLWRQAPRKPAPALCLLTVGLLALSTWVHGAWYLWVIVPAAFIVLGEYAAAGWFVGCWLAGSFLGAALTGHPFDYLGQQVAHLCYAFGHGTLPRLLVGEFHPTNGCAAYLIALAVVWLFRRVLLAPATADPGERLLLTIGLLGWIGGLLVSRWWSEWGLPATVLWLALLIQQILEEKNLLPGVRRLALVALSCAALLCAFAGDRDERWSRMIWTVKEARPSASQDNAGWLPEPGGLVYNSQMFVFSLLFLEHPKGAWRYVYGFESGLMTPENLRILRDIQFNVGDWTAYRPWVARMNKTDRLIVISSRRPEIPDLDWKSIDRGLWSGRRQGYPRISTPSAP